MIWRLRRWWASLGVRMAAYYALLVALTLLAALAILYVQTVGVMYQRMTRHVYAAAQHLEDLHGTGGGDAVANEIRRTLADELNAEGEIYLQVDPQGRVRAGNLDHAPALTAGEAVREVMRAAKPVRAYLVSRLLPDGSRIVVGRDLRDQENLESLVGHASAATGLVALVLLVGGTFVFRLELDRSIARLRRVAARVGAGDLAQRMEVSATEDEFGLLHRDVNDMLDRMQLLMDGVRHVSDTIAHNLRTPLTRVMLRLRRVEREGATAAECKTAIGESLHDLEELTRTFEKLLQIAEAETGARRRSFEAVELNRIADEALEFYGAVAEAQCASLEHHLGAWAAEGKSLTTNKTR
ncbi:MAG: HAMP domain-containing protein [Burkholderiales bacterium]